MNDRIAQILVIITAILTYFAIIFITTSNRRKNLDYYEKVLGSIGLMAWITFFLYRYFII